MALGYCGGAISVDVMVQLDTAVGALRERIPAKVVAPHGNLYLWLP
jgi:hypothetical protein